MSVNSCKTYIKQFQVDFDLANTDTTEGHGNLKYGKISGQNNIAITTVPIRISNFEHKSKTGSQQGFLFF